jgi:predicted nucleic acid-binding Zn ribbon protein
MTWRPDRPAGADDPRPVGSNLDRIVRRFGGASVNSLDQVFSHWDEVVGPAVAAHARPLSLRDGVLAVAVDSPAWATQLRLLGNELLGRLSEAAGTGVVTALDVRVRP